MTARTLMVLGSMSSAGKSLLVTGLCRLYARKGVRVAPFKAQNMSNNAAVCAGGEIGRAQAAQAYAAGLEPHVDMNPVLLKPEADARSQVILRGQVWDTLDAKDYYARKQMLWSGVTGSLDRLREKSELVIMEGAGSPVELNLRRQDIVNMAVARYADAPCLLVGDIDRGGVFAQLLGTLDLLEAEDRRLVRALVINKFRGDLDLFSDGVRMLEDRGGVPVLGVLPYLHHHGVPDEDAAALDEAAPSGDGLLDVAVIHLPHISNFDDFDPLRFEPGVHVRFVRHLQKLGRPDALFLPGSKNTISDLAWLEKSGFADAIRALAAAGVPVIGFCGGFQMMGTQVQDEGHVESEVASLSGLGLLPVSTRMASQKTVTRSHARIQADKGFFAAIKDEMVTGYEIHLGRSNMQHPLVEIIQREGKPVSALDGACSVDGKLWGCHLHALLENDNLRRAWLVSMGVKPSPGPFKESRQKAYDGLADAFEKALDMTLLDRIIQEGV